MNETQPTTAAEMLPAEGPSHEAAAHEEHHDHAHVAAHVRKYMLIGAVLLFCTGLTVALSYFDFGTRKLNITVAMIVATIKAGLVAAIFMHLNAERQLIYRILIFTVFFVLALFFLTYLHWYDPVSR